MSLLPEFIFRTVIVRGIRTLREDTRYLDQLFRNLDATSSAEMRQFMLTQKIYIDLNYPREALKLPAIIILLKSENESQAYLGDSMGTNQIPEVMSYDSFDGDPLEDEILGGAASVSTLSGLGKVLYGPDKAVSSTSNTLKIGSRKWVCDTYITGEGTTVHIIGGAGVGQQREVVGNNQDTLMVKPNWTVLPDSTSVFVIRAAVPENLGTSRAVYDRAKDNITERLGSLYNLSYQIQIICPNPELTIYLHAIVKAIFTLSRTFLEGQGIINMQMGATDFLPRAEYQPDHAYMRALNVDFMYPFDVFKELGDLATSFHLQLIAATVDGNVILSDTVV